MAKWDPESLREGIQKAIANLARQADDETLPMEARLRSRQMHDRYQELLRQYPILQQNAVHDEE